MVYLYEWIRDRNDYTATSLIKRRTTVRLFWLDEIITQDWDTDRKYMENMTPMANIADGFIRFLKKQPIIANELGQVDIVPMNHFNPNITFNGNDTTMFSQPLAGVETQLELPLTARLCECLKCK